MCFAIRRGRGRRSYGENALYIPEDGRSKCEIDGNFIRETAAKFLDKIPNIPARRYAIYLGALVLQYKQILNEHKECFHFSPIAALGDIILGIRVCEEMILYTCIF